MEAVGRFGPPVALMGLIFFLSAQPDLNSGLGLADTILRKCAHAAEFGLLFLLWWRALRWRSPAGAAAAAAIAVLYAVSDEWHQTFVEGRVGSPVDVAIDSAGVLAAWLAARAWVARRRRRRARPAGGERVAEA